MSLLWRWLKAHRMAVFNPIVLGCRRNLRLLDRSNYKTLGSGNLIPRSLQGYELPHHQEGVVLMPKPMYKPGAHRLVRLKPPAM